MDNTTTWGIDLRYGDFIFRASSRNVEGRWLNKDLKEIPIPEVPGIIELSARTIRDYIQESWSEEHF